MKLPDFSFETELVKRGNQTVAGADEVGRGSFAGPVVAAIVIFKSELFNSFSNRIDVVINDSKKLSALQREKADRWIRDNAFCFGIGKGSVGEINTWGIVKATHKAYRRALGQIRSKTPNLQIDHILLDAFLVPNLKGLRAKKNQTPIVKGDQKSVSIAAASIIAKVFRDALMSKKGAAKRFKIYGWEKNKGYGTFEHRKAIKDFGPSNYHREKFIHGISDSFFSQEQSDV